MDDVLLVNMLEAYGIPCLKNYPGDGQFGKIMLGMSGYCLLYTSFRCCSLIYKMPVLWRSGAAARWSRLHTPVETGTSPDLQGYQSRSLYLEL